jgi:5'-nucleotidase
MTGADLESVVRGALEGTVHSGLDYSGLVAQARASEVDGKKRLELVRVEVGGAPLDPARKYQVAVNSFLAGGGDGFAEFSRSRRLSQDPALLRDVAEAWFARAKGPVEPPADARIVEVQP